SYEHSPEPLPPRLAQKSLDYPSSNHIPTECPCGGPACGSAGPSPRAHARGSRQRLGGLLPRCVGHDRRHHARQVLRLLIALRPTTYASKQAVDFVRCCECYGNGCRRRMSGTSL